MTRSSRNTLVIEVVLKWACWQDQDILDFVEGLDLVLFWATSEKEIRRRRLKYSLQLTHKTSDRKLYMGLEYTPERSINVQKYYMR
jgi:hypothetical protein